ncbi:TPA: chloride channel protein [Streptococcus suis]
MFIDKIKLVILSVISGILVGLGAIILHSLFNIIWIDILQVASPSWRSQLVIVSGLVSSIGWYFLQRKGKELVSVEKQIFPKTSSEQFPDFGRQMGHILLQIVTVGLGSPIGKEVAPRELGSLFSTYLAKKVSITAEERSVLVASTTVAGLAAIYQIPFASILFAFEVYRLPLTFLNILIVAITSYGATFIANMEISNSPLYQVVGQTVDGSTLVFSILMTVIALPIAKIFRNLSKSVSQHRTKDKRILWQLPLIFILLALLSYSYPDLLGNGALLIQASLDGLRLTDAMILFVLKFIFVLLCLRFGSYGGTMTPSISIGAALGEIVVLIGSSLGLINHSQIVLVVASCSFLGITMNAPLTAGMIVYSFIGLQKSYLLPILISISIVYLVEFIMKESLVTRLFDRNR